MEHFSDNREFDLYRDINTRTNGEIYIGVVGPVRTVYGSYGASVYGG